MSHAMALRWLSCTMVLALCIGLMPLHAQTPAVRAAAVAASAPRAGSPWTALEHDGLHDPANPGIGLLQQPGEALSALPRDSAGNQVRWVQALDQGVIQPRANLSASTPVRVRDQDIIISKYGSMPAVLFPHRQHTLWLDCANCHDGLFKQQAGVFMVHLPYLQPFEDVNKRVSRLAANIPLLRHNLCPLSFLDVPVDDLADVAALLPAALFVCLMILALAVLACGIGIVKDKNRLLNILMREGRPAKSGPVGGKGRAGREITFGAPATVQRT